jgi:hypothetical protein
MKPAMDPVMRMRPRSRARISRDLVQQVKGAGHVGVEHQLGLREVFVEEGVAQPASGIGQQRVDGPAARGGVQAVDSFHRRQVDLERL